MKDVISLTRGLIKIPSPSGEEKELGNYIVRRLKKNFKVVKQKIGKRFNILATKGKPKILLTTHLDTVPGILKFKEDKKFIYGRGACDAKGIIATMIIAAERLVKQKVTNFGLLFTVNEETDFIGTKKAKNLIKPKFVIVGEPTNFKKITGQKGLLAIKIIAKGKSAPGSTPEKGISAIDKLIVELNKLKKIKFNKGTTLNIGLIKGGKAINVVPDYAEVRVELRTTVKNNLVLSKIKKKLKNVKIKILYSFNPRIKGKIIVPYFTEMYFWKKSILIGPGKQEYSHSKNEKISKKDLEKGVNLYTKLIKNYLNKGMRVI